MNQTLNILKKKSLLLGAIVAIILIVFLSSINKKPNNSSPLTVPLIPSVTIPKVSNLPKDFTWSFTEEKRISISSTERIVAQNNKGQLVLISGDNQIVISPNGQQVVNYTTSGDTIIIETGIYQSQNNQFYLYDLSKNVFKKLDLSTVKPISSYSINPKNTDIAILGNYDPKTYTTDLFVLNVQDETIDLVGSSVQFSEVFWASDDVLILGESSDKNEPNYDISLFSIPDKEYLIKEQFAVKKSITVNDKENIVYFIDSTNNIFSSISLVDKQKISYFKLDSLNYETILYPNTDTIGILSNKASTLTISTYSLSQKSKRSLSSYSLGENEQYIEKYRVDERYYVKTYNKQTRQYSIKALNLTN